MPVFHIHQDITYKSSPIVENNNFRYPLRPIVKILESSDEARKGKTIDLLYALSTVITKIKYYV